MWPIKIPRSLESKSESHDQRVQCSFSVVRIWVKYQLMIILIPEFYSTKASRCNFPMKFPMKFHRKYHNFIGKFIGKFMKFPMK